MYKGKGKDGKYEEKGWVCVDMDASSTPLPDWCNKVDKNGAEHAHVETNSDGKAYCVCKNSKVLI